MQRRLSKGKIKRQDFNLHWNVNQKQQEYNALQDPHTNYYFVSKAAKRRLRDLKSEIKKGKQKSPKTRQFIQQINSKIKFQFPKIKLPLLQNSTVQERQAQKQQRKLSEQFKMKIMTERGYQQGQKSSLKLGENKKSYQQLQPLQDINKQSTVKLLKSKNKLKSMKQIEQQTNIDHNQFLSFLQRKKMQIRLAANQRLSQ